MSFFKRITTCFTIAMYLSKGHRNNLESWQGVESCNIHASHMIWIVNVTVSMLALTC